MVDEETTRLQNIVAAAEQKSAGLKKQREELLLRLKPLNDQLIDFNNKIMEVEGPDAVTARKQLAMKRMPPHLVARMAMRGR